MKTLIIIFIIIGFWIWFFKIAPLDTYYLELKKLYGHVTTKAKPAENLVPFELSESLPIEKNECDKIPPQHGSKFLFSKENVDLKLRSRVYISNEHIFPVLITFAEVSKSDDFGVIYMSPNQSSEIYLPVDKYQLKLQSGSVWCNFHKGFVDSTITQSSQVFQIEANEVSNLRIMPFGDSPSDFMLSHSSSLGLVGNQTKRIQGYGALVLEQVAGGHYAIAGTINRLPVYFLVDTGATKVTVPESFAKQVGIRECNSFLTYTANGVVKACQTTVSELTLGQFTLKNVEIVYHKGLPNDTFLLGMNVIGLFKMEQQGGVMKLSR
ncbi:MAG: retropepsin-like aspartic protease [Methylophilus sp.]|nr:retropepsin-like aspartic protease [Methylophilus sp.]